MLDYMVKLENIPRSKRFDRDISEMPLNKQLNEIYRFIRVYEKYSRAYEKSIWDSYDYTRWEHREVYSPSLYLNHIHPPIISKKIVLQRRIPNFMGGGRRGMNKRLLIASKKAWKEISKLDSVKRIGSYVYFEDPNVSPEDKILLGKNTNIPSPYGI